MPLYIALCYWRGLDDVIEEKEVQAQMQAREQVAKGKNISDIFFSCFRLGGGQSILGD